MNTHDLQIPSLESTAADNLAARVNREHPSNQVQFSDYLVMTLRPLQNFLCCIAAMMIQQADWLHLPTTGAV